MDNNILKYITPVISDVEELQNICKAISIELDRLDGKMEKTYLDQYVYTLTADGCSHWEKMLGIPKLVDDTVENRRFRIAGALLADIPYTKQKLRKILNGLLGEGNFTLDIINSEFLVKTRVKLANFTMYDTVVDLIARIIPANMISDVALLYNTHGILRTGGNTHGYIKSKCTYGNVYITDLERR